MSLALTTITKDLEALIQAREEILSGEMCGTCLGTANQFKPCDTCNSTGQVVDTTALEQIELAIKQYSQELLPNKVDAYWWTLKKIGKKDDSKPLSQQAGLIPDAKREIKRLQEMIDRWESLREHLSSYALEAMSQQNKKVLEGTNGRKLRRQSNGGVLPVEIAQESLIPEGLTRYTVTMKGDLLYWLIKRLEESHVIHPMALEVLHSAKGEPDLTAIREVLEAGEGVPGARLGDRGEHLRVV
jgi:hypothetical protein